MGLVKRTQHISVPDGVGGCLKTICDNFVANGRDITNIDTFIDCATANCKSIDVIKIDDTCITEIKNIVESSTVRPSKMTFKILEQSTACILHARRLSCIECPNHIECSHFETGQIPVHDILLSETSSPFTSRPSSPSFDDFFFECASTVSGPKTPQLLELFNTVLQGKGFTLKISI